METQLLLYQSLRKVTYQFVVIIRGISLINVGLKIISKIITDRISTYALSHNFIRPEQFGFRNREECISLFISIREICQRRKFQGKFTYLAFLDLKKAYDSVPIFNILTKNYIIMEYVVNVLIFYVIYILHLKHVLDLLQCYQMNFLLKEVFVKVVHYHRSYSIYSSMIY